MRAKTLGLVPAVFALTILATGTLVVAASPRTAAPGAGQSRLVSIQQFPSSDGDMCAMPVEQVDAGRPTQSQIADAGWAEPLDDPKEVIIATAAGNTILTFSVPEVFDRPTTTSSR